jgi:hypothetical protein
VFGTRLRPIDVDEACRLAVRSYDDRDGGPVWYVP